MPKDAIFFATIAAGGGHVATARAMMDALDKLYPGRFKLEMSDLMLELGFAEQDKQHKDTWRWMLKRPWTARWGQRFIDTLPGPTVAFLRRSLDAFSHKAAEVLQAHPAELIVSNHGWLTVALTRSQRRYGLKKRVLTFATEPLDASALWADREAEHFVAPSLATLRDLARMGVSETKIDVIGYPVGRGFLYPPSQQEARRALGLAGRFTCLISLGGEGMGGDTPGLVKTLLEHFQDLQLVVICGRNESLRRELSALTSDRLFVAGFVDTMPQYLAACDVVVGKAGPASVFEALAVGKPVLVTSVAGMNEVKIVRYLEARGLGRHAPTHGALTRGIEAFRSEEARNAFRARCAALGLKGMSESLGRYLAAYYESGPPEARLRGGLP